MQVIIKNEGTLPVFFMNDKSAVTPNANYCGFQLVRDCACSKVFNKWISFYLKLFIGTNWESFSSVSSLPHSLFPVILKVGKLRTPGGLSRSWVKCFGFGLVF